MAQGQKFSGWIKFEQLDVPLQNIESSFTIGYKFLDGESDDWTKRFSGFKDGEAAAVHGGINLMMKIIPLLVTTLNLQPPQIVFIPALSSNETVADENGSMAKMAKACAECAGTHFVLDAIRKEKHAPLHSRQRTSEKRKEILDNANHRSESINAEYVFIFDDLITRGETLSHTAQAILAANKDIKIYGIALGKNERHSYTGGKLTNGHIPPWWEELWDEGEKEYNS
ncbi:MAG: phosphoribosyltransferase [Pseudohongiellaceae bacterium]